MSTAAVETLTENQKKTMTKAIMNLEHGDRGAIVYPDGKTLQPPSRYEANAAAVAGVETPGYKESDPHGKSAHTPGAKMDAGKAPVMQGVVQYFPRALKAVSFVSLVGAKKYAWKGWESVPDGINRYSDALGRHLLAETIEGPIDADTQQLHAAQVAWNALARLELMIREQEAAKEPQ